MSAVEYCGVPEFFASRVQHIEDMHNGNFRIYYCVDRQPPGEEATSETVVTVIIPKIGTMLLQ